MAALNYPDLLAALEAMTEMEVFRTTEMKSVHHLRRFVDYWMPDKRFRSFEEGGYIYVVRIPESRNATNTARPFRSIQRASAELVAARKLVRTKC